MSHWNILIRLLLVIALTPNSVGAQGQKVVVIPLIGNESEITPIPPQNLIEQRGIFTTTSDRSFFGTVTDDRGIVLQSILVAPEQYPSTFNNITLRFCRTLSSGSANCSHGLNVPNNTISNIEFGIGDLFTLNGPHYIDIIDRGGLPQNVANQIILHISGYYYNK